MDKWVQRIVDKRIAQGKVPEVEREIYAYGYTLLIEKTIIFSVTILIAILVNRVFDVLFLCISFIPLRQYAGGYHAKNRLACIVLSVLYIMVALSGADRILLNFRWYHLTLAELLCIGVIYRYAPVSTEARPLSNSESRYFRKMTMVIWGVETVLGIIFWSCGKYMLTSLVLVAHLGVTGALGGQILIKYIDGKCDESRKRGNSK